MAAARRSDPAGSARPLRRTGTRSSARSRSSRHRSRRTTVEADRGRAQASLASGPRPLEHSETASAFSTAFHRLGFLRKYKSYGIKFSSPFGYSIFTLHDGKGFSVQVHQAAKVEAFHVFRCHDAAYADPLERARLAGHESRVPVRSGPPACWRTGPSASDRGQAT